VGEVGRVVAPLLRAEQVRILSPALLVPSLRSACAAVSRKARPGCGGVAEWLGDGLQTRVPRFESELRLWSEATS
jgi:hypothetical protein